MIFRNGYWSIDKEETGKDIVEVESGATGLALDCWIYEEEVPAFPGAYGYTVESTRAIFTKLIIPESVVNIGERALYRCETVREISVLKNVTSIGKEAFKGCIGLSTVVAPLIKVTEIKDTDSKMKLAVGYCLNDGLFSEEISEDYIKYIQSQKTRVLRYAEKYNLQKVKEFLVSKGIIASGSIKRAQKGNGQPKKVKLNETEKILLLEKAVLKGDYKEVDSAIRDYKPFETMSRALGLACRCRTTDIVKLLVDNDARPDIEYKIANKHYGCMPNFLMLIVVNNIWRIGSFERHYVKEHANSEYSEITNSYIELSDVPIEMRMGTFDNRLKNIKYLIEKNILKQKDINRMLYYSILEQEYDMAEELEKLGAVIDVPWIVADANHSSYISEFNHYIDALCRVDRDVKMRLLETYGSVLEKNGKKMYINEKAMYCLGAYKDSSIMRVMLIYGDTSRINKTQFLTKKINQISIDVFAELLNHGFITSNKMRDELIETATIKGQTEMAALLLDYKNKSADLAIEEIKREKELMASPDSAYALKKLWITKKKDDGTLCITSYKGEDTNIVVPSRIGNGIVTEIGEESFSPDAPRANNKSERNKIIQIVIPETVNIIGDSAFANCKDLTEVVIPDSINTIGAKAFFNCSNLNKIILPNSVTNIGDSAFANCKDLTEVVIPDSINTIGAKAFFNCSNLNKIILPDSVTSIGDSAFANCSNLNKIIIPNSVTSIENSAFKGCSSLSGLKIPNSVKHIGSCAFHGCSGLADDSGMVIINSIIYFYCGNDENVIIPKGVAEIGALAFSNNTKLKRISIPEDVTRIGFRAFDSCSNLSQIHLPNRISTIEGGTFFFCKNLSNITIPKNVKSIEWEAFRNCINLTTIEIPDSVENIYHSAFSGCNDLVIKAHKGSYAMTFAKEYNISVEDY